MRFNILGPMEVIGPDRPVTVKGEKTRILLAALLLQAGQPVSVDRLIGALWGAHPPGSALANVRTYAHQLRKLLGASMLTTQPAAYRLDISTAELDLAQYERMAESGEEALRHGDLVRAADQFDAALRLWRGRPLEGLELESWMQARVAALDDRHRATHSAWVDVNVALGKHETLIPRLRELAAEDPLSERIWIQLIKALYESGRTGDALAAYDQARAVLAEELGLEPSPDLQEAHMSMLRRAPEIAPAGTGVTTVPRADRTDRPCQIPPAISDFVGRTTLCQAVVDIARSAAVRPVERGPSIVAITGGPGIGKSTLAIRLAHELQPLFPDGQVYVPLTRGTEPRDRDEVFGELLSCLGHGRAAGNRAPAEWYRSWLANRRVLLLLDDAADTNHIRPLLPRGGATLVLVTSRIRLAMADCAHQFELGPLRRTESLELLGGIIGRSRVAAETAAAIRIVDACEGLPLAIRIVGARLVARWDTRLEALADRLRVGDRRLDEFALGTLTLRASLQRSYQALSPFTRQTLENLGALGLRDVTAPTLADLLEVPGPQAERVVAELMHHNLLAPVAGKHRRYRLNTLFLDYARERAGTRAVGAPA
jgi:DNA-binding SARP family transcriptional activator